MTLIPVMASPDATELSTVPTIPPAASSPALLTNTAPATNAPAAKQLYTCPMHPEVISDKPGQCPKCGINLVPVEMTKP